MIGESKNNTTEGFSEISSSKMFILPLTQHDEIASSSSTNNNDTRKNNLGRITEITTCAMVLILIVAVITLSTTMYASITPNSSMNTINDKNGQLTTTKNRILASYSSSLSSKSTAIIDNSNNNHNNFMDQSMNEKDNTIKIKVLINAGEGGLSNHEESLTYALSNAIQSDIPSSIRNKKKDMVLVLIEERDENKNNNNKNNKEGGGRQQQHHLSIQSKPIYITIPHGIVGNEKNFLHELIEKEKNRMYPFPFVYE